MRRRSAVPVFALVLLTACSPTARGDRASAGATATQVAQRIQSANQRIMAFFVAGQPDSIAALYLADAHVMPPNQPAAVGTAAIRKWAAQGMDQGTWTLHLTTTDLSADATTAIELGTYTVSFTPNVGASGMWAKPFSDAGKYLVVWKKRGERWMIADDIYNSSLPPAPAAAESMP